MKFAVLFSVFALAPFASAQSFTPTQNAGTDVVCAAGSDVITGLTCNNSSDATSITAFASSVSIPAGTLSNNQISFASSFSFFTSGTTPTVVLTLKMGTVVLWASPATAPGAAFSNFSMSLNCTIRAVGASSSTTPLVTTCAAGTLLSTTIRSTTLTNAAKTVAVDGTAARALTWSITYSANTTQNAAILYGMSSAQYLVNGHTLFSGTAPTASACGASCALVSGSSDNAGTITVTPVSGEFIQSATLTFGTAFTRRPSCRVGLANLTQTSAAVTATTTAVTFNFSSPIAGPVDYSCF